jgi:glycosyltransferase involved in cell wall biosynthesis
MENSTKTIQLSIVIRARNEEQYLQKVFEALLAQDGQINYEIIVVNNESEDGTELLCTQYGVDMMSIRNSEFTYGRAINRGIAQAKGEIILLLSAHSLPVGSEFLAKAVKPFEDSLVAAARCISITDFGDVLNWYAPKTITGLNEQVKQSYRKWLKFYPSASCCTLRRKIWEEVKFDEELEFHEDKLWGAEVVQRGYKVVSCVDAFYYYMRDWPSAQKLKRLGRSQLALYRITGRAPVTASTFVVRMLRALFETPRIAFEYLLSNFLENVILLAIPLQARIAKRKAGILPGHQSKKDKS